MADLLKNIYTASFVQHFSEQIAAVVPSFKQKVFIEMVFSSQWEHMELKQRMKHIAFVLHDLLHKNYKKNIPILFKLIHHIKASDISSGRLEHMFFSEYVELYGLEEFDASMKAIEEITQFISCEFAVRPFIKRYPKQTMAQMLQWSQHSHPSVRRLASEGCRPRLPWAMALPDFKKDPGPVLPILENLKNDSSEYVRRSVANNLNDIAKDHPLIVVDIIRKWKGIAKETDWILRHGSRTLLKKAHADVLPLFGFVTNHTCRVSNLQLVSSFIKIGEVLEFSFRLTIFENESVRLRIEYAIYYMKANGKCSRKLFKLSENNYSKEIRYEFKRKQSFKNLTTRKHYPGFHKLTIVINGTEMEEQSFQLQ